MRQREEQPRLVQKIFERNKMVKDLGYDKGFFLLQSAIIAEAVWRFRNDKIFGDSRDSTEAQIRIFRSRCKEIWNLKDTTEKGITRGEINGVEGLRWQKPLPGWVKVNMVANFRSSEVVVGMMARDLDGEVVWMLRSSIIAATQMEAKMAGVYLAILVAKFRNVQRLVGEWDNKQIVESLEKCDCCPNWSLEPLFD